MPDSVDNYPIYSVSEITREIKELLEFHLPTVWVEGELSNFVRHSSGHLYFSLKDKDAQIACVMWKNRATILPFTPQNGMKLKVYGAVRVYEKRGNYQLDIVKMMPAGIGDLQVLFDALKAKLYAEGLFDDAHKKALPLFPERIGIVTSPTGAALHDILNVLNRRFPSAAKILRPTLVQGDGAAEDIAAAIRELNDYGNIDVMIVGRGGGSLEDLWAFNEEVVARAIYDSSIPVISAVGHEIDFTICDFVADKRAPTPSAAAELVVPDYMDIKNAIAQLKNRCTMAVSHEIDFLREKLDRLQKRYAFRRPLDVTQQYKQRLDDLFHLIHLNVLRRLSTGRDKLQLYNSRIKSAHPTAVLSRGYAIVQNYAGTTIKSVSQLELEEKLHVYLGKGSFTGNVTGIQHDNFFNPKANAEL